MAFQNIGASNRDDAFYRYKMPKMITKIEGRGNGIKTNIVNMVDIAKALARPTAYTTKYFGCELGAQSKFDEKTGVSIVNGAMIQQYWLSFWRTSSKNPTRTEERNKGLESHAESGGEAEGEAADEEQGKLKKDVKKKKNTSTKDGDSSKSGASRKKAGVCSDKDRSFPAGSQADDNEVADDNDDVQWQTDTSMEAAQRRIQEQLNAVTAEMVMLLTTEVDQDKQAKVKKVYAGNGTKQSQKKPEFSLSDQYGNLVAPHDSLVEKVKDTMEKGCSPTDLRSFLGSISVSPQEVMAALFDALFEGVGKGFAQEVGKKLKHLSAAVQDEGSQTVLLQAIEDFCAKANPDAVKEVALGLKNL